jgi:hypothetical protein
MRNVSGEVLEEIKTLILCLNTIFLNCAVYEIKWKNNGEPHNPQMNIWHMLIAYWTPKATNTDTQYLTFIVFPLQ